MRRRGAAGQAALELLAAVPAFIVAVLLAWQLVAVVGAGLRAEDRARRDALGVTGAAGRLRTVQATVAVPPLLPGADGLSVRARVVVRAP